MKFGETFCPNWRRANKRSGMEMIKLGDVTPVLRMFDELKAREFYLDCLGFQVNWEHRFGDNFPLHLAVGRDGCELYLSEHHGDCSPGGAVRVAVQDIDALHGELAGKDYKFAKPRLETTPWNTRELSVTDPFGNRLCFFEPVSD